ncbi:retrotransposon protein, putative, ty1-copia subclass, partial [Tanacetum coccineum]
FSPVADIRAIRILIAIAAYYDYEIWQMDVKTAFLNGRLDEDIYMEQPEGYVNPKYPNRVCKLQRSIYGLKQASRQWNKRFDEEIKKFGFTQNRDEPCVYRKASGSNVVFLILYVDDILIMGNNIPRLKEVKDYLGKCFSMKDLGEAAYILGIKIYRDRSKRLIGLSQSAYIDKILKKFNMHNSKKGYLPMEVKHELSNEMCASTPKEVAYMKKVPYASAVGSIMYVVRCTRPDVAFAQNLVSRYQQNPGKLYWVAVKHILKYLRNTRDMFLVYGGKPDTELNVTGFCNASWQCDKDDTKSQTGYVFVVNGGAAPDIFYGDIKSGEIKILKVHTNDNLADPFNKALPRGKVTDLANGIGLQLASSFMHTCSNLLINFRPISFLIYGLVITCLTSATVSASYGSNETDYHALLSFKSTITHDPDKVLTSWNDSFHFCEWSGILCGKQHKRVTVLILESQGLEGSLSPHVGNLSFLRTLSIRNNSFQGAIPHELGRLSRLRHLYLNRNNFIGVIPVNLSSCSNLEVLSLARNKLGGSIPKEMSLFSKLTSLEISKNKLTGGIPSFLGNITSMEVFSCVENPLGGSIPDTLGLWKSLTTFYSGGCNLYGSIPRSIQKLLPNLEYLQLRDNELTGVLPPSISNCSNLGYLEMANNKFSAAIVDTIVFLCRMKICYQK